MKRSECAFLILTILIIGLVFLQDAHANNVNGTINSNTTWTTANSPINLTADVTVNKEVTLTIQPGVTVNFGSYQLIVNGILNAKGTTSNKIIFSSSSNSNQKIDFTSTSSSWNEQSSSGCIIENAIIYSVAIFIEGVSPKIDTNYFASNPNSPIIIRGGSPLIINNAVNLRSTAEIHVNYGSPIISYNTIKGQGLNNGIYTEGTAVIFNNNITSCYSGLYVVGASTIEQNIIMNNINDGIRSNNSASIIQNNVIGNNQCGISGEGNIQSNTITDNTYGLWGMTSISTITNNNIFSNIQNVHLTENASVLGNLANVNAINNWWGTTDESAINQTIWDYKNAANLGTVNFAPFLNEPNPLAPSKPPNIPIPTTPPTPSPTTSFTSTLTPTPEDTGSSTPNSTPIATPMPDPSETSISPSESHSSSIFGNFTITDIENMLVIVLAIALSITIVFIINMKFGKNEKKNFKKRQHN